jgi:hypothetical protein
MNPTFYETVKIDEFVKSRKLSHSREGGSPAKSKGYGFLLPQE